MDSLTSKDGNADVATFYRPAEAVVDAAGATYVADWLSIRKIAANGTVTTFATGFWLPGGIALDGAGGLYVADTGNNRICPGVVLSWES